MEVLFGQHLLLLLALCEHFVDFGISLLLGRWQRFPASGSV